MGTMVGVITLVNLGIVLFRSGLLAYADLQEVFARYRDQEATPENIEALRQELLAKAQRPEPVDDPEIRAALVELGVDPESLRIPAPGA